MLPNPNQIDGVVACEAILRECFVSFSRLPGAEVIDDRGVFGVRCEVPLTFFNGIAFSHFDSHSPVDDVVATIDRFRSRKTPFRWWISPATAPKNLPQLLEANGMRFAWDAPAMVADLSEVEEVHWPWPDGLDLVQVATAAELDDWVRVFIPGFLRPQEEGEIWRDAYLACGLDGTSQWTHFVGYVDGKAVATTSLMISGRLAGVYHVLTLPEARGRGIGSIITLAAMHYALRQGCTHAVLQASEMGFSVYRSIGFVEFCTLSLYDWRPEYDSRAASTRPDD